MDQLSQFLRPRSIHTWRLWLLITIFLAVAAFAVADTYRIVGELEVNEVRYQRGIALSRVKSPPPPSRVQLEEAKRWAALRAEREFPWYPIFVALEQSNHPDIELLEFQPDKATHSVLLRGEARSKDALIEYIDQLSKQTIFSRVFLKLQKNKARERMTSLTFEIHASIKL